MKPIDELAAEILGKGTPGNWVEGLIYDDKGEKPIGVYQIIGTREITLPHLYESLSTELAAIRFDLAKWSSRETHEAVKNAMENPQ